MTPNNQSGPVCSSAVAVCSPPWPVVVSFGGGTNSAAMLIEMAGRRVVPDLILFADTGGETPQTYKFVSDFSTWLTEHGMPPIVIVKDGRKTLEAEVREAHTLPSLVFGFRSCSDKYKVRPQNRYLAQWKPALDSWAAGGKVVKLVGFDVNETHRIKDYDDAKFVVEYPLARWGWDRMWCAQVVKRNGFEPGKSACFYCPASRKSDVLKLAKENPRLFERAVAMERNATAATTVKGLGRHWSWEQLVRADEAQMRLLEDSEDLMPCGCFDAGV